jgi:REase_AHJR-like
MDFENDLKRLADGYWAEGYSVILRPGPNDLPPFAKDFKVEIVASAGCWVPCPRLCVGMC